MVKRSLLLGALIGVAGCTVIVGDAPPPRRVVVVQPPRLIAIPGTAVSYAEGVSDDVLYHSGIYYKISGGVWYRRPRWGDPWVRISVVPSVFLRIPPGHRKHHIVRHHPSFRPPAVAAPRPKPVPVTPVVRDPRVYIIPGTSIHHAALGGEHVFRYGGRWYKVKGNTWHVATKWGGSWSVTRSVPSAFLKIPSSHTAHACVKAHPNYKPPSRPSRVTRPHPVHPVHPVRPGSPAPKPPTAAVAREPGVRAIPRTGIQHAVVRGAHVFRYGGRWYKVSGRTWYVSTRWGAAWTVTASVPDVFLKIPSTHSAHSCVKVHPKYRAPKKEKDDDDDKGRPKRWGPRKK